jgi:hypothetical protein
MRTQATGTVPGSQKSEPQKRAVLVRNWSMYPVTSYELKTRNPTRLELLSIVQCYPTSFMRTQATGVVPACHESEQQNRAVLARNGSTYPVTLYVLETKNPSRLVLLTILQCYPTSFLRTQATGTVLASQKAEPHNRAVLVRNGCIYPVTSYELKTRNSSSLELLIILQCYPTSFMRTQATGTVLGCRESKQQNRAVLARNGCMYPVPSYELETRNPSRVELLSILQRYPTSFIQTQATGTVPAGQESEPQNHAVLPRNGSTYHVTSYELETRNPSRLVLLSIPQCYPTSFMWTRATGTVPSCQESEPQNHAVLARNGSTYPVTSYELEM